MSTLTVISPHQDDAALSLACCLASWSRIPDVHIRVVNCFTVSTYSPYTPYETVSDVSTLREVEDERFNMIACEGKLQIVNLGFVDSLLRLSETNIERILEHRDLNAEEMRIAACLAEALVTHVKTGVIIVPLGVGHHIDHCIATRACTELLAPHKQVLFYLDVPYWLRMKPADIRRRVVLIEGMVNHKMVPYALRPSSTFQKSCIAQIYSSQLCELDVEMTLHAPFKGEILLEADGMQTHFDLELQEIAWTDLNL